jgi:hypothetical protein
MLSIIYGYFSRHFEDVQLVFNSNLPRIRHRQTIAPKSTICSRRSIEIVGLRIAEIIEVKEHVASVA